MKTDVDFSRVAEAYDAYRTGYSDRLYHWILGHDDPASLHILDVATGTGIVALELARRGAQVVGVDLAEGMLALARARAQAEGLAVAFVRAQAETFGATPRSFDRIVCGQAFHWLAADAVCPLWRTLLRSGGRIAVFRKDPAPGNRAGEIMEPIYRRYTGQSFRQGGLHYREPFTTRGFPDLVRHFPDGYPLIHFFDLADDVRRYVGYLASLGSVKEELGDQHGDFLAEAEAALRAEFGDREFVTRYQESLYLVNQP